MRIGLKKKLLTNHRIRQKNKKISLLSEIRLLKYKKIQFILI